MSDHEDQFKAPIDMVSEDYEDLRPYMPKLSFINPKQLKINRAKSPLEIEGKILEEN